MVLGIGYGCAPIPAKTGQRFMDLMVEGSVQDKNYDDLLLYLRLMPQIAQRQGKELADKIYAHSKPGENLSWEQVKVLYKLDCNGVDISRDRLALTYVAKATLVSEGLWNGLYEVIFPDFPHERKFTPHFRNMSEARLEAKKILVHESRMRFLLSEQFPQAQYQPKHDTKKIKNIVTVVTLGDLVL